MVPHYSLNSHTGLRWITANIYATTSHQSTTNKPLSKRRPPNGMAQHHYRHATQRPHEMHTQNTMAKFHARGQALGHPSSHRHTTTSGQSTGTSRPTRKTTGHRKGPGERNLYSRLSRPRTGPHAHRYHGICGRSHEMHVTQTRRRSFAGTWRMAHRHQPSDRYYRQQSAITTRARERCTTAGRSYTRSPNPNRHGYPVDTGHERHHDETTGTFEIWEGGGLSDTQGPP